MKRMKRMILVFSVPVLAALFFTRAAVCQPLTNYGVPGSFSNIRRRLLLRQGTISAADLVNAYSNAVPVGDGTYYFRLDLVRGAEYNFIFQALMNDSWQYEQIPDRGSFPASVDLPGSVTAKKDGLITKTSDEKTRRKITVPVGGTNYHVFCNFGHHPNPPSVEAVPLDGMVALKIRSSGRWGGLEPDVEYGGWYTVYRSGIDRGPYALVTNIPAASGGYVHYTNRNLANNSNYYFVVTANDAYGRTNALFRRGPFDREVDLPDYSTYVDQENIDANMYSGYSSQALAVPRPAVRVIFKVENLDWDTARSKGYLVWLTPEEEDGRFFPEKVPARIVKAERIMKP